MTSVLKFNFTFSTKESETAIDIEDINEYFVSEPQKVSNECVSSTEEPEVTNEIVESNLIVILHQIITSIFLICLKMV